MSVRPYRYQLPQKAIKSDCPGCGPKHRKTLSRYVDTQTGESLPEIYGRCDRESNCGYHLSPYHKAASGISFAEQAYEASQHNGSQSTGSQKCFQSKLYPTESPNVPKHQIKNRELAAIPFELVQKSLGHYQHNQFARLLIDLLGADSANRLLTQFQIGTSRAWNKTGACIFWLFDEQGRARGGQIKLFDQSFHTVKYLDKNGRKRSRTSWIHSVIAYQYDKAEKIYPDWLTDYIQQAEFAPCLFGLPQLLKAPKDKPVAIVEAPKTAVLCSYYFPQFIWLAVIGRSYLNVERLSAVRNRHIILFPDLSTEGKDYHYWENKANDLRQQGFSIQVSDYLERHATAEQQEKGYDLADFLLESKSESKACSDENYNASSERIVTNVRKLISPSIPILPPFRLPRSLEYKWCVFGRPPLYWNRIATYKALLRCLEPQYG